MSNMLLYALEKKEFAHVKKKMLKTTKKGWDNETISTQWTRKKKLYSGKANYFEDIQNITFFHKNIWSLHFFYKTEKRGTRQNLIERCHSGAQSKNVISARIDVLNAKWLLKWHGCRWACHLASMKRLGYWKNLFGFARTTSTCIYVCGPTMRASSPNR